MKKNKILKTFIAIILLISLETASIAASTGVVNVDTVRVRAKATTDSGIVALVSIGDKVTITGEEGNWYKVQAKDEDGNTKTGYIRKDLLTVDGETTTNTSNSNSNDNEEKPEENNGNAEQPEANNNSNNNDTSNPATELTNGEQTPNQGTTSETPNENTEVTLEENDKTIDTITKTANLSAGSKVKLTKNTKIKILPSAYSSNIVELQANTEVTVLEVINSWCRIETTEGACGWVRIDQ